MADYSFNEDALRKANGGDLPAESAKFKSKYNGRDPNHNKEDVVHRLLVNKAGDIVGETVFIPKYNDAGKKLGAEASLVAAVNDPAFNVAINEGKFSVTGPETLKIVDAKDIARKGNKALGKDGKPLDFDNLKDSRVIPAEYPKGKDYDYHAYLYLHKGKAPDKDGKTNVSKVLFKETGDAPEGKTGKVGEVYVSEGSADLTVDYAHEMKDQLRLRETVGCHHKVTFCGFEKQKLDVGFAGNTVKFQGTDKNLKVDVEGIPDTLDIAFARPGAKAGEYVATVPWRGAKDGNFTEQGQDFADKVELNRLLLVLKGKGREKAPENKPEAPDRPDLPLAAMQKMQAAAQLFDRGITDPMDSPAAKLRFSGQRQK